jgi:hypothetical protein
VRLFYNDRHASRYPDRRESVLRTPQLAQRTGAEINLTWQSGGWEDPEASMTRFAGVLSELVDERDVTNLRWVTVQNEPNTPTSKHITPEGNVAMHRALEIAGPRRG